MPSLDDFLKQEGALPQRQHVTRRTHPKGWEPGVAWDGASGTLTTEPVEAMPDWDSLLSVWGLDPLRYEVDGTPQFRAWDGIVKNKEGFSETKRLFYYKATIRERSRQRVDDKELARLFKRPSRKAPDTVTTGRALIVGVSDWQIGKGEGGGTAGTVERLAQKLVELEQILRDSTRRKQPYEQVVLACMGDLIEGCFAAETEVVTRTGVRRIGDLAREGKAVVKTLYGAWVEAEVRSFGVQRLYKVTLSRGGGSRKEIYATREHRWFRLANPSANHGKVELQTHELTTGDMLVSNFGKHPESMSPVGVMAGYVFGDGHRNSTDPQHGSAVNVHVDDFEILKYFEGHPRSALQIREGKQGKLTATEKANYVKVSGLPAFFKAEPDLDESLPYLFGWAAGYFAADGSVGKTVNISSARREHLELFASVCARIGIGTNPITSTERYGTGAEKTTLYRLSLVPSTIPDEFFVLPRKAEQFQKLRSTVSTSGYTWQKNAARCWRVISVEETDRVEEVYCAVVPKTHSFTLANDILTGNCNGHYSMQTFQVDLDRREQERVTRRVLAEYVRRLAPLTSRLIVAAVPGNHGEHRSDGKAFTTWSDNSDLSVVEGVAEIVKGREGFEHVSFVIADKLTLTLDVCGVVVGLAHGHAGRVTDASKLARWWGSHALSGQPIGDAQILITGHYHHLKVDESTGRTWIQVPAMDGGSAWWTESSGQHSHSGMMIVDVGNAYGQRGWNNVRVI